MFVFIFYLLLIVFWYFCQWRFVFAYWACFIRGFCIMLEVFIACTEVQRKIMNLSFVYFTTPFHKIFFLPSITFWYFRQWRFLSALWVGFIRGFRTMLEVFIAGTEVQREIMIFSFLIFSQCPSPSSFSWTFLFLP